jgi:hypothetical protein
MGLEFGWIDVLGGIGNRNCQRPRVWHLDDRKRVCLGDWSYSDTVLIVCSL